jgi:hypothetical protein
MRLHEPETAVLREASREIGDRMSLKRPFGARLPAKYAIA